MIVTDPHKTLRGPSNWTHRLSAQAPSSNWTNWLSAQDFPVVTPENQATGHSSHPHKSSQATGHFRYPHKSSEATGQSLSAQQNPSNWTIRTRNPSPNPNAETHPKSINRLRRLVDLAYAQWNQFPLVCSMALSDTHQASIQYDTCRIYSIKYQNRDLKLST